MSKGKRGTFCFSRFFFLTFKISWLDLVSYCELVKILHLVPFKVCFKENYFHKQAVITDKGSPCSKGLKYRKTTRSKQVLRDCAFKKLPTETTVSADETLPETEQELKCHSCNSFRSPNRQTQFKVHIQYK